jgi:protein arginine kinase
MTLEDLIPSTGEWLRGEGPASDVVVSSRIRLARNLSDHPFLSTAGSTERTEIFRAIADEVLAVSGDGRTFLVEVDRADPVDREVLVERHLISRQHAMGEGTRGVAISSDETRAVMINEEDHLRMQALRSGLQLRAAWEDVSEIDDVLGERLPFAFDRQLGYLTACPTNVGTGIRASVMVHLPALKLTKEIERVARAAKDMRLAIRGLYGEGTEAIGDLYQISNQVTLGVAEEEVLEVLGERTIPKIVDYEKTAQDKLARTRSSQLDDKIWRAYGILCHARRISSDETQTLLSSLRMGIHLGRFDVFDLRRLNELFLHTQPAHLQKLHGRTLSEDEQGVVRADYLRSRLSAT